MPAKKVSARGKERITAGAAAKSTPEDDLDVGCTIQSQSTAESSDVDSVGSVGSRESSKRKGRPRADRRLTEEQELEMVEFLKANTCMWDMKHLNYRNAQLKQDLWEELATKLSVTSTHLKAAFKNLQTALGLLFLLLSRRARIRRACLRAIRLCWSAAAPALRSCRSFSGMFIAGWYRQT